MKKSKVSIDFSRYNDSALEQKANDIKVAMTGNTHFTTPSPTLAVLTSAISTYATALSAKVNGGKAATANKNTKRADLVNILQQLGIYVQLNSASDTATMLSSGFNLQKASAPHAPLGKPHDLLLKATLPGRLVLGFKLLEDANSYVYQYTTAPSAANSVWITEYGSTLKHEFKNLVSGRQYIVRVAGIGTESTLVFSDEVSSFVL
jgi:hypothetical protein